MKKGLTCLLFTFIMIAAPTAIKAQGLTTPIHSITAKIITTQQTAVSSLIKTVKVVTDAVPAPSDINLSNTSKVLYPLDRKDSAVNAKVDSTAAPLENKAAANAPNAAETQNFSKVTSGSNGTPAPQENPKIQPPDPTNIIGNIGKNSDAGSSNNGLNLPVAGKAASGNNSSLLPDQSGKMTVPAQSGDIFTAVLPMVKDSTALVTTNVTSLLGTTPAGVLGSGKNGQDSGGLSILNWTGSIVEGVHLGQAAKNDGAGTHSGLVQLTLPLLGTVHVGGVEDTNSGLVQLDLPLLESISAGGVGDTNSGLVQLDLPLLGSIRVGGAGDTNSGLVQLDLPLLGSIRVGGGEVTIPGSVQIDLPILGGIQLGGFGNQQKETNSQPPNPPPNDTAVPGGEQKETNHPSANAPPENDSGGTGNQQLISDLPGNFTGNSNQENLNAEETEETVHSEAGFINGYSLNEEQIAVSQDSFIGKQNGNKAQQEHAGLENASNACESDTQVDSTTAPLPSSGGSSGGGAGGSSSPSGGSGMSAYLGSNHLHDLGLSSKVQFILKELSDEWTKAPLIQPPKAFFFLSV